MNIIAPLVGMHFRPPASDVVNLLPVGTKLILQREPLNPYDSNAIRVLLPGFSADGERADIFSVMKEALAARPNIGEESKWDEESLTNPFFLGYVANSEKTGGKFADQITEILDDTTETECAATLIFSMEGKPQVNVDFEFSDDEAEGDDDPEVEFSPGVQDQPPKD